MSRLTLVAAFLLGCGTAEPEISASEAALNETTTFPVLSVDDLSRVDVRGTVESIGIISQDVQALDTENQALAAESLAFLMVNCPFTRAGLQLPYALHQGVMAIDADRLDPFVQGDWLYLQEGLAVHVEVLEALEVDLSLPIAGDALYRADDSRLVDAQTLAASEDPVGLMLGWVPDILEFAEQVDAQTQAQVVLHSDRVEAATGVGRPCPRGPWSVMPGQSWTLGLQIGGWHDALRRIQPFVDDPAVSAEIDAMIQLLDRYGEAR